MSGVGITAISVDLMVSRALFDDAPLAATAPWRRAALSCARKRAAAAGQTLVGETPQREGMTFIRYVDDDPTLVPRRFELVTVDECDAVQYQAVFAVAPR